MSAILPPSERLWWKHPLDRLEAVWIGIAFVWCMIMFFIMVDKYTVRTETDEKIPVVAPPEGSDVYLIARLWNFWPILELEKGKSYKLHLTSMDYNHGLSIQPTNINIQVVPGYEHV